jgi:hypothetical protein
MPLPALFGTCTRVCSTWRNVIWASAKSVGVNFAQGYFHINGYPVWRHSTPVGGFELDKPLSVLPFKLMVNVTKLELNCNSHLNDEHVRQLLFLPKLEALNLWTCTGISDLGFQYLGHLGTKLTELNLGCTSLTDSTIRHLTGLSGLRVLYLHFTNITDDSIWSLLLLKKLRTVSLTGTKMTHEGRVVLMYNFPHLQIQ